MITLSVLCLLYFLPTIVASHRGHGVAGILLLNLLLGWTVIGWFALLLWSILAAPRYLLVSAPPMYPQAYVRR